MNKSKITIVLLMFISLCTASFAQSNSNSFDVVKSGQGKKSILFIPGFSCSGEVWNETKTKFEKEYTCYTLTMSGFADAKPQINATFINWETSIARFIKENKIDKPTIIGHSMGGSLAMALASDYPNIIGKIIVVDALPCLTALMNPSFKSLEKPDCSVMSNQIISANSEQFHQIQKMSIQSLVADSSKHDLVISWSMKSDRKTFAEMYCDFSNTDLREKIKTIKCPSLILLEPSFKNLKPAIDEQFKNLKTANIQYANKGLHFIMYDDKEWYFSQLDNFITTN